MFAALLRSLKCGLCGAGEPEYESQQGPSVTRSRLPHSYEYGSISYPAQSLHRPLLPPKPQKQYQGPSVTRSRSPRPYGYAYGSEHSPPKPQHPPLPQPQPQEQYRGPYLTRSRSPRPYSQAYGSENSPVQPQQPPLPPNPQEQCQEGPSATRPRSPRPYSYEYGSGNSPAQPQQPPLPPPQPQEQYQDPSLTRSRSPRPYSCIPQHEAVYSPAQPQRLPPPNPQPSPPPSPKPECPLPSAPTRKPERPPARPQPDLQAYPGPHKVHLCRGSSTSTQNLDHGPEIRNNSDYQALRARAIEEGSKMAQCFEASHTAYESGEHARAKELSTQGNAYKAEMKRLNELASEWIFAKKNKGRALGEVDLHGLYVREAIPCAECAVEDARRRGDTKINLIVGIGRHSPQGVAKLKPAIEEWLQRQGLVVELDPKNSGVLIVNLDGLPTGAGPVLSADEISRCFDS